MRCIVLLLAAVSWAAATWSTDTVKVFTPNREYRYDYESQILTGIPLLNSQYSGVRIKARVIMHIAVDNYVSVKLTGVQVFRVKEEPGVIPTKWVPEAWLEPIPAEHAAILVQSLVLPIKFRYDSGIVTKVYALATDPFWSVNIKRGIVSMMNLDLNIENPIPVDSIATKSFMNVISPDYTTMSAKTTYRVVESSVMGDCQTVYSLVPVPSASKMIISKVIDTRDCAPKIMGEWGIFAGIMPEEPFGNANNIVHPSVAVDYELSGTRHEFLIESAVLTGRYVFAPIMKETASIDGYVVQQLKYIKDGPIESPITFASAPVPLKKGLHAYIPIQDIVTAEAFSGVRMAEDDLEKAKIEMVDNLLEAIVEKTTESVAREVPALISTMVTILRKMSKPEIIAIIEKYFAPSMFGAGINMEKKQMIIMDVISTLPHPEAPVILVEMIKRGYITSDIHGAWLINVASLTVAPSPAVINAFVQMVKDPVIRSRPMTYRAIILGSGILANKLVNMHIRMGLPPAQTVAILKGAVKEIKAMLEISNEEEKIAVIKAIGNAGILEFIPDIERVIKDKSGPIIVREQAIFALRRLAPVAPMAIQSVLLPVYLDIKEPEAVRVAAFLMIMETKPAFAIIHMIGHSINYEPNVQIAAFAYRYLLNMAKSIIPQLRPVAMAARRVLMIVRPIIVSPHLFSGAYRWEAFSANYGVGSILSMERIHAVNHNMPYAIISRLHMNLYGRPISIGEIGVNVRGLDGIVRKLVGMGGIIGDVIAGRTDISQIFDGLQVPDMGQIEDEIRAILSQTNMPAAPKEIVRIVAFMKLMGHELNYVNLGKEELINIINSVKTSTIRTIDLVLNGYKVDVVKALPSMDNTIVMPTPVGLPISVNISVIAAVAIKGNIRVEGVTSLRSIFTEPSVVTVGANLRPSFNAVIYQTVGIQHDIIQAGTTVRGNVAADLPMSVSVTIDKILEKISVKIDIPRRVSPEIAIGVMPAVFTHFVPLRPTDYTASMYDMHLPKVVPIICDRITSPIPIKAEYVVPVISMKANVQGVISSPLPSAVSPVLVAISRQEVIISFMPTSNTPEAVLLEVIYGERKVVAKKTEASSSWFGWFSNEEPVEETVVSDEFIPVVVNPIIANPIKRQVFINLMTVGGYDDAKITSKWTLICDPSWRIHQINMQIVGSPFIAPIWKAKIDMVVNIPKFLETVVVAPTTAVPGIIAKSEIAFGTNTFRDNSIIIKVAPIAEAGIPVWPITESPIVPTIAKSVNMDIIIDYSQVASNIRSAAIAVVEMIKPIVIQYVIPYVARVQPSDSNSMVSSTDSIRAVVQIVPKVNKVNAVIALPSWIYFMSDIPIPDVMPFTQVIVPNGIDRRILPTFPMITSLTTIPEDIPSAIYDICTVEARSITTLDCIPISIPDIDSSCKVVLAHDCSEQRLYTVVSTPVSPNGVRTIKVIVPHSKVEISQGFVHQGVVVKINGVVTAIPDTQPLIITRPIAGREVPVLSITSIGRRFIITAPAVGISVVTDGIIVEVKVSPLLRSTACGVCAQVPSVPIAGGSTVIPTIANTYSILPVLSNFVIKSAQCPAVAVPVMPA